MKQKNIFISFSFESSNKYKENLEKKLNREGVAVNYSEKEDRSSESDETIWKNLKNRISGSSIMIVIYSKDLEKGYGGKACKIEDKYINNLFHYHNWNKQGWIYKELRCALRNGRNNGINGIFVIVPDELWNKKNINNIPILKNNYDNKKLKINNSFENSFIPWIKMTDFYNKSEYYINKSYEKRSKVNEYDIVKETD